MCIVYEFNRFKNKKAAAKVTARVVKLTRAFDDFTFVTIAPVNKKSVQSTIAVPSAEDNFDMEHGDVIRFQETSMSAVLPSGKRTEVPVVCKAEPIKGEIVIAPITRIEYQAGHPYARHSNP